MQVVSGPWSAAARERAVRHVAIVGGGFAGAVAAIKLIDASSEPLAVTILEPAAELGRGIAYATEDPDHLVNGPAKLFGLHPESDPLHLARWLARKENRRGWLPEPGQPFGESFPPRQVYGDYVASELRRAVQESGGRIAFVHVRAKVEDVVSEGAGARLLRDDGQSLLADQVVLATGLVPAEPRFPIDATLHAGGRYVADPWQAEAFGDAAAARDVVLLGSGLTMLDAIISLEKRGFRGRYHAVSRHGLIVQPRRGLEPWADFLAEGPLPTRVRDLLALVQRQRRAIAAAGEDWQRLPPSVRAHVGKLWAGTDDGERRRFARHLRRFWDISLHRAAPQSFAWLEGVQREGRFVHFAGTVTQVAAAPGGGAEVELRPRGRRELARLSADLVVACLGHSFDWTRIDRPLERNLLARRLVHSHPTGYGIAADATTGAVLDGTGRPSPWLFAVGHPLRGASWESSSISEQIAGATTLAATLARPRASQQVA